ncbi:MAG: protein translocase subunit SecD [Ignavibacteria bacterium]|nr:protein translocase subunit SecD [Ignavibacteria bacterium]
MRKNRFRIILTLIFIALSVYFLYPTYKDYQFNKEIAQLKTSEDSLAYFEKNAADVLKAREKRLKLGLDLQGGMYVIMEVDIAKLLLDLSKKQDDVLRQTLEETSQQVKTSDDDFIDIFESKLLQKGTSLKAYYGELRDDEAEIRSNLRSEVENAIDRAIQVVRNRVDQYGVSEPVIQKKGSSRLVVELPGVSNVQEVRSLLQGTALLEFKLVIDPEIAVKVMQRINTYLAGGNLDTLDQSDTLNISGKDTAPKKDTTSITNKKDTTKKEVTKKEDIRKDTSKQKDTLSDTADLTEDTNAMNEQMSEEEFKKKNPWFYLVRVQQFQDGSVAWFARESDRPQIQRILSRREVIDLIPNDVGFYWSHKPVFVEGGEKIYQFYILKKEPELTGGVVVNARANIDPQNNTPVVYMEMNSDGAADWARITGANINKQIAIVLDNSVYSAPVVRSKITGGNSQIEGMANIQEAKLLEIVLKAGALPAPLSIIEERTVGPSLGEDSIQKGLYSSLISLVLVALFMVVYYRFAGGVADIALLFNFLFVMGIMASFQATLTLPGIAGLILTIGMAVDSNVLIYERIREELWSGKPIKTSIEIGYKKALSAIIDSHVTSVITGIILYQFGTGPIQGFALTLIIGLVANLFTAIIITRIVFDIMTDKGKTQINFG